MKEKLLSVIVMWLSVSMSFISAFNTAFVISAVADTSDETCAAVAEREKEWPIVQYCAEPAVVGTDNQFYVYVDKHSEEAEFAQIELAPKGINIQQVEPLTSNTVSFVDGKIIVYGTGQFIIHGDDAICSGIYDEPACSQANCKWHNAYCGDPDCLYENEYDCLNGLDCAWDYFENHCYNFNTECSEIAFSETCTSHLDCAWQQAYCSDPESQLKLVSTNKKVQLFPTENCIDSVSFMLYVQESGRERYIDVKSPLEAFSAFVFSGLTAVRSQIQPSPPTEPETLSVLKEDMKTMSHLIVDEPKTDMAAAISGEKRASELHFYDESVPNFLADYIKQNFPEVSVERYQRESSTPGKMLYFLFISRDESDAKELKAEYMKVEQMDHENVGILLGFPEEDAKFFVETIGVPGRPRKLEIVYEAFRGGIEYSPELFFADYIYRSVDATDSLQYVRSRLLIEYEIFGDDYLLSKFKEKRSSIISEIRFKYSDELTSQDIRALENYFPTEEDFLVRLELLTGTKIKIERYIKANEIGKEISELQKPVNDAWEKKDLDGLKAEIGKISNLFERIQELPDSNYKDALFNAYGELHRLGDKYESTLTYDKFGVWDLDDPIVVSQRVTDSQIKNANAEVKKNIFESQITLAEKSGEISLSLPEKYIPTSEAAQSLDEAGLDYIRLSNEVGSTVEELAMLRAAETLDKAQDSGMRGQVPDDYKNPIDIATSKYGNLIYGAGLTALFAIGPRIRELGNRANDATLLLAADVVQFGGFAVMAGTFITTVASVGLKKGILHTLALLVDPINILGLESGALAIDLPGFVIFIIAYATVNYTWCKFVDATSKVCGCSPNPVYGKAQLGLEKNIASPDETINFVVYGMQHCGATQAGYTVALLKDVETKSDPMKVLASCLFEEDYNGRCCERSYRVDLEEGEYEIYGEVQSVSLGGGWKPYTDEQILTVGADGLELSSIPLEPGWNLISAPYSSVTLDTSACTLHSKALHYAAGSYQTVDIVDLEGGVGYWTYSYDECEIELTGIGDTIDPPTELVAGWNQIAVPLEGLDKGNVQCDQIEDPKEWDTETSSWVFVEEMVAGKSYFVDCYPEH